MALHGYNPNDLIDFVPDYGDNRESESPCIVSLRFVPYPKVQHYARLIAARTKNISNPQKLIKIGQDIQKQQFIETIESIRGYFIGDKEITEPEEFYSVVDTDLVYEITKASESAAKLSEGQRKNS